jgi:predicted hydrocarbon binding protein
MNQPLPSVSTRTAALPVEFFAALRMAIAPGDAGIDALRDAGFQAGQSLFDVFATWLSEQGEHSPDLLTDERFAERASAFFAESGWGEFALTMVSDAVVAVDAEDWIEAEVADGAGCQISTGMLAGFFGRIADAPMSVLEVECQARGDSRCRFLVGSIDVLGYVHEAMGRGIPYERASTSA